MLRFLGTFYYGIVRKYITGFLRRSITRVLETFIKSELGLERALKNWGDVWSYPAFPYLWANEYKPENFICKKDTETGLFVTKDARGVQLYFPKNYFFMSFCLLESAWMGVEQDLLSPHRYVTKENKMWGTLERSDDEIPVERPFFVEKGDVVADIGASNGNFSISVIENAKHIYLFEGDENWDEPLQKTFEKYKDKITIVKQYVGDADGENTITLDTFFKDKEIHFIKIDVDGFEQRLLNGAKNILRRENVKWSICTYHKSHDAKDFEKKFKLLGYETNFTDGFMFFPADFDNGKRISSLKTSYLRRGILRAKKNHINSRKEY